MAKMTLIGMYNYDQTLFNGLTFPAGIDKDIAVNEILVRANEFCVLYTDPDFMKIQIGIWGQKHFRTFEKWVYALAQEFNPLHNYDRHEEFEDHSGKKSTSKTTADYKDARTVDMTADRSPNLRVTQSENGTETNGQMFPASDETKVSAYDSSTYQPKEKTTHDIGTVQKDTSNSVNQSTTGSDITNNSGTDDLTRKGTLADTSGSETVNSSHTAHLYGNIGVTTSTQMLEDYLRVERWNIYENIADIFVDEFCIQIY
jgi:hypothetical protein